MTSRCRHCNGVDMVGMPMSDGIKCGDCGIEWRCSHPDPLSFCMKLIRQDIADGRAIQRIRAIKWYRTFRDVGLREAKAVIDDLVAALEGDRACR